MFELKNREEIVEQLADMMTEIDIEGYPQTVYLDISEEGIGELSNCDGQYRLWESSQEFYEVWQYWDIKGVAEELDLTEDDLIAETRTFLDDDDIDDDDVTVRDVIDYVKSRDDYSEILHNYHADYLRNDLRENYIDSARKAVEDLEEEIEREERYQKRYEEE